MLLGEGRQAETTLLRAKGGSHGSGPQALPHLHREIPDSQATSAQPWAPNTKRLRQAFGNQLARIFSHAFLIDNVFSVLNAGTKRQVIKLARFFFFSFEIKAWFHSDEINLFPTSNNLALKVY